MTAVMTVDLSELDAWAAQVQRASDDLAGISRNGPPTSSRPTSARSSRP